MCPGGFLRRVARLFPWGSYMTDAEFLAWFIGSLVGAYWLGFQWGKYAKIIRDLGNAA